MVEKNLELKKNENSEKNLKKILRRKYFCRVPGSSKIKIAVFWVLDWVIVLLMDIV